MIVARRTCLLIALGVMLENMCSDMVLVSSGRIQHHPQSCTRMIGDVSSGGALLERRRWAHCRWHRMGFCRGRWHGWADDEGRASVAENTHASGVSVAD